MTSSSLNTEPQSAKCPHTGQECVVLGKFLARQAELRKFVSDVREETLSTDGIVVATHEIYERLGRALTAGQLDAEAEEILGVEGNCSQFGSCVILGALIDHVLPSPDQLVTEP